MYSQNEKTPDVYMPTGGTYGAEKKRHPQVLCPAGANYHFSNYYVKSNSYCILSTLSSFRYYCADKRCALIRGGGEKLLVAHMRLTVSGV